MKFIKKGIFLALLLFMLPSPVAKAYTEDYSTSENEKQSQGGFSFRDNDDGTVTITNYIGNNNNIIIPDTIDGKEVSVIANSTFNSDNITSIIIPGSVIEIGSNAFYDCDKLETVTFTDDGLEAIGNDSFNSCKNLQEFTFPTTLETVGDTAFSNTNLENVLIPTSVEKWGERVFYNSTINTVTVEDGVTKLGLGMFNFCKIDTIDIPSSVTKINDAFYETEIKSFVCQQGSTAYKYAVKNNFKITYKGPYINITNKSLYVCDKVTLKLKKGKASGRWTSSNKAVATVSSKGVVTAKKKGSTTISIKYKGQTYSCKIKVKNMVLSDKKTSLIQGEKDRLKLTGSNGRKIVWNSSNSKVVSVSKNGYIKGKQAGKALITAKCKGITLKCYVTVRKNQYTYATNKEYTLQGNVYILPKHAEYDGYNLKIQYLIINNTNTYINSINGNLCVYKNNYLIGKRSFSGIKVNVKPYSTQTITLKVSKKQLSDKEINLTTGNILPIIEDGQCMTTYYY